MQGITLDNIEEFSIPLREHPLKWRFEGENDKLPSQEFMDQITPLLPAAARYLWKFESTQRYLGDKFIDSKYFKYREEFVTVGKTTEEVKKWLYQRGIPFDQKVFYVTQPEWGFVLTWKMIIKFWEEIFFGSDEVIWDRTLNWVLVHDHNDVFYFGKDRLFNSRQHSDQMEKRQRMTNKAIGKGLNNTGT